MGWRAKTGQIEGAYVLMFRETMGLDGPRNKCDEVRQMGGVRGKVEGSASQSGWVREGRKGRAKGKLCVWVGQET